MTVKLPVDPSIPTFETPRFDQRSSRRWHDLLQISSFCLSPRRRRYDTVLQIDRLQRDSSLSPRQPYSLMGCGYPPQIRPGPGAIHHGLAGLGVSDPGSPARFPSGSLHETVLRCYGVSVRGGCVYRIFYPVCATVVDIHGQKARQSVC